MAKIRFAGPEKRQYLRVPARCVIKYTKLSKNLRRFIGMVTKSHTEDICERGVKFIVKKKIPVRTILEFQFKIPGTNTNVVGLSEVVRTKPRRRGRSYDVGLKFLWVQLKNAKLIDSYVRKKRIQEVIKKLHKK
ncbi:MAG: PilZ domain-containing protein [Candidatus Omnitrophica bacterium]|nr:PilZ domain-containing protein [Candidatus Omnitrophota bacterium]